MKLVLLKNIFVLIWNKVLYSEAKKFVSKTNNIYDDKALKEFNDFINAL